MPRDPHSHERPAELPLEAAPALGRPCACGGALGLPRVARLPGATPVQATSPAPQYLQEFL
jgi:hypothetical protein